MKEFEILNFFLSYRNIILDKMSDFYENRETNVSENNLLI